MPAWWDFVSEPRSIMMPSAQYDTSFHTKAGMLADRPLTDQLIAHTTQMLRTYAQYYALDGQIRALETSGQHDQAVTLDTGSAVGQSDWAFAQFDAALGQTLGINEQWFADSTQRAFDDLNGMDVLGPVAGLIVGVLAWLGLQPRIAEYRGVRAAAHQPPP